MATPTDRPTQQLRSRCSVCTSGLLSVLHHHLVITINIHLKPEGAEPVDSRSPGALLLPLIEATTLDVFLGELVNGPATSKATKVRELMASLM